MKNQVRNKVMFIVCLLFGLLFIIAGVNKLYPFMPLPDDLPEKMTQAMDALVQLEWMLPLVAIVEIVGGILVIIPKYRALAALMLFPIMVGIVLINIIQDSRGLPFALVLSAILGWILYDNRHKYSLLFK